MEHTAEDGKIYNTDYYSLDAISVGYKYIDSEVKS